jgi:hypothetical protein
MTRILKTLLGSKRKEMSAEEIEAMERANFLLRCRVERMVEAKAAA